MPYEGANGQLGEGDDARTDPAHHDQDTHRELFDPADRPKELKALWLPSPKH